MVFSIKERTDWRISQYSESNYQFWDRSSWPLISLLRDCINQWATDMPADNELMGRLRARTDPRPFVSAMFELVFYTCCKKAGLPIERIPAGTVKTTDFRITRASSPDLLLECALAASAMDSREEQRRTDYVLQLIEDMVDFPYIIFVRIEQMGTAMIRKRALRKSLQDFATSEVFSEGLEFPFCY